MSEPLRLPTQDELDAIRARADAANPGPWEWAISDGSMISLGTKGDADGMGQSLACARCEACQKHDPEIKRLLCMWPNEADKAFIEHSRADVPALLHAYSAAIRKFKVLSESLEIFEDAVAALGEASLCNSIASARRSIEPFLQPQPADQPKPTAD